MTKTQTTAPPFTTALLELITEYGDYRALVASVREEPYRVINALAAQRTFDDIGAALRSGVLPTRGMDARLDVAFASLLAATALPNQDDHLADYGFHPTQPPAEPCLTAVGPGPECANCGGPTSGVHSNHTRTEDAAAALADAEDGAKAAWLAPVLNRLSEVDGPVRAPVAPVAVSPERVAEIRRELNLCGHNVDREANVAGGTAEIGSFDQNALVVTLVDGQRIAYRSGAWRVQS
jgi:hypothetical protein